MGGVIALIGGVIVLAVIGVLAFFVCLVISNRTGYDISQITDTSNISDIQGKVGQIKEMLANLRNTLIKKTDELKVNNPVLSKVFTARGMSCVCFFFMLFFCVIPLRFTWGFPRVEFGILWLLQIALLIVFAVMFSKNYFQLFIIPIGTYFLLAFVGGLVEAFKYEMLFRFFFRIYCNFSGVVFLLTLLAVIGMFFLTFFLEKISDTKPFIITCIIAIPINYLALCVNYGGLFRSFLLIFDFSFWMYAAFLIGVACLTLSKKNEEQAIVFSQQDTE